MITLRDMGLKSIVLITACRREDEQRKSIQDCKRNYCYQARRNGSHQQNSKQDARRAIYKTRKRRTGYDLSTSHDGIW